MNRILYLLISLFSINQLQASNFTQKMKQIREQHQEELEKLTRQDFSYLTVAQKNKERKKITAIHDEALKKVVIQALDTIHSKLQDMDKGKKSYHQFLDIAVSETDLNEIERAIEQKAQQLASLLEEIQEIKLDPEYRKVLRDPMIQGSWSRSYGRELDKVRAIQGQLGQARIYFQQYISQEQQRQKLRIEKEQQINDLLAKQNPYEILCIAEDVTLQELHAKINEAYTQQVKSLKDGSQILQTNNMIHNAISYVAWAKDWLLNILSHIDAFKEISLDDYFLIAVPKGSTKLFEISKKHELKKQLAEQLKQELLEKSVSQNSCLYQELLYFEEKLDIAKSKLVDEVLADIKRILHYAKQPSTVIAYKLLLNIVGVVSQEKIEDAYQASMGIVHDFNDVIGDQKWTILEKLEEAKATLLHLLNNPIKPRDISNLTNYQIIGLDEPTQSIIKIKKSASELREAIQNALDLNESVVVSIKKNDNVKKLHAELRAIQLSEQCLIERLIKQLKNMISVAHQTDIEADRILLPDIQYPATVEQIEKTYADAIQLVEGAGDYLNSYEMQLLQERLVKARDSLYDHYIPKQYDIIQLKNRMERLLEQVSYFMSDILNSDDQDLLLTRCAQIYIPTDIFERQEKLRGCIYQILDFIVDDASIISILEQSRAIGECFVKIWNNSVTVSSFSELIQRSINVDKNTLKSVTDIVKDYLKEYRKSHKSLSIMLTHELFYGLVVWLITDF